MQHCYISVVWLLEKGGQLLQRPPNATDAKVQGEDLHRQTFVTVQQHMLLRWAVHWWFWFRDLVGAFRCGCFAAIHGCVKGCTFPNAGPAMMSKLISLIPT